MLSEPVARLCAAHPHKRASITCKRCGTFACSECTVDTLWGDTMCAACEARGLAQYPIPWDRSLSLWAFLKTIREVTWEVRRLFRAFPDGGIARPFGFALLIALCVGASTLTSGGIVKSSTGPVTDAMQSAFMVQRVVLAFEYVAVCLEWSLAPGLGFHLSSRIAGGRLPFRTSMRASAYLSALQLLVAATHFVPWVIGTFLLLGLPILTFWAWLQLGKGRVGLSTGRSVFCATTAMFAALLGMRLHFVAVAVVGQGFAAAAGP